MAQEKWWRYAIFTGKKHFWMKPVTKMLCATDRWHTDFMLVFDSDGGSHVICNVCACYQPKCLEDNVI